MKQENHSGISFFQRYLTVWVAACMPGLVVDQLVDCLAADFRESLPEIFAQHLARFLRSSALYLTIPLSEKLPDLIFGAR